MNFFPSFCVAQENQTSTALSKTPSQKSSERLNQYLIFQKIEQIHSLLPVLPLLTNTGEGSKLVHKRIWPRCPRYSSLFFERVRATSMTQRRAENTLANLFHFRLYRLIRLTRSIIENRRSGVGMSGTLVPMSTGRPAGTHQNFIILGTAGYRVP